MKVHEIKHPLIENKLNIMRSKDTSSKDFSEILNEIATLMSFELFKDAQLKPKSIETPVEKFEGTELKDKFTLVPILRAGLGMMDGFQSVVPKADVGHIGVYRKEETLEVVDYLVKLSSNIHETTVILIDPMLATGASANYSIGVLKEHGVKNIKFVTLVSCPEGIKAVNDKYPDVEIFTASIDKGLNDKGYIYPGLGDAGDRIFKTK